MPGAAAKLGTRDRAEQLRRASESSNFSHHHDNDYDLELRNRETIKSNAERQAAQQLENAKVLDEQGQGKIFELTD
jgi:hypothetical protein